MNKAKKWFISGGVTIVAGIACLMVRDSFLTEENPLNWLIAVGVPVAVVGLGLFITGFTQMNKK